MRREEEEPNRVLGFPVRPRQAAGQGQQPPGLPGIRPRPGPASQREEPQRVLGFAVDWFGLADRGLLARLARPIREFRQRVRRRPPSP